MPSKILVVFFQQIKLRLSLYHKELEFVGLRAKTYSYIIDDGSEDKKAEGTNKRKLKFEDYKNFLEATQLENEINHVDM